MRMVDGLMAIPSILLAIAIVSLWGASLWTVLVAITIPEVPRVVRLVRSLVLSAREEPYVEAAIAAGTPTWLIMRRHLMPNTIAPLIIQGTYICACAILTEAILSFLGAGINPETPSWGNIMAEGRIYFQINPGIVLWPGLVRVGGDPVDQPAGRRGARRARPAHGASGGSSDEPAGDPRTCAIALNGRRGPAGGQGPRPEHRARARPSASWARAGRASR